MKCGHDLVLEMGTRHRRLHRARARCSRLAGHESRLGPVDIYSSPDCRAAVIGVVLVAVQQTSDRRRAHAADVSAYRQLLDAPTPLRILGGIGHAP